MHSDWVETGSEGILADSRYCCCRTVGIAVVGIHSRSGEGNFHSSVEVAVGSHLDLVEPDLDLGLQEPADSTLEHSLRETE